MNSFLSPHNLRHLFDVALWLAGIGHFCILGASFQVPYRLHWKEDFAKLTAFNRKLTWTYAGFTVFTIIAFGILTLVLHSEFLNGDRSAIALSIFIGVYWLSRIMVDFFYFGHSDWPKGTSFVIGHFLLSLLFAALAFTYLGLVSWHLWLRS